MALLVNTHYKLPWIVWSRAYQLEIASGGYIADQTIPHGLPFIPMLFGQWATSSAFNPSYDLGINVPGGGTGGQPLYMCQFWADKTNVHITAMNNSTSTKTFSFRLMAFAPPDYTGEVTPVNYNSPFSFNSHYRYQQILMQGQSSGAVNHNLGYLPQSKVWAIVQDTVLPAMGVLTEMTLNLASTGSFYYHIYKDEF